jgi:hypothetical protein
MTNRTAGITRGSPSSAGSWRSTAEPFEKPPTNRIPSTLSGGGWAVRGHPGFLDVEDRLSRLSDQAMGWTPPARIDCVREAGAEDRFKKDVHG